MPRFPGRNAVALGMLTVVLAATGVWFRSGFQAQISGTTTGACCTGLMPQCLANVTLDDCEALGGGPFLPGGGALIEAQCNAACGGAGAAGVQDGYCCYPEQQVCRPNYPAVGTCPGFVHQNQDTCNELCVPSSGSCGDGELDANEECEDGNTNDGDGCSSQCMVEAGFCSADGGGDSSSEEGGGQYCCQWFGCGQQGESNVCNGLTMYNDYHSCDAACSGGGGGGPGPGPDPDTNGGVSCGDGICQPWENHVICVDPGPNDDPNDDPNDERFGCRPICEEDCGSGNNAVETGQAPAPGLVLMQAVAVPFCAGTDLAQCPAGSTIECPEGGMAVCINGIPTCMPSGGFFGSPRLLAPPVCCLHGVCQ